MDTKIFFSLSEKRTQKSDVFNQGLAQPTSDNNHSAYALIKECKHLMACLTDVSFEVLVLVNQSNQKCLICFLFCWFLIF